TFAFDIGGDVKQPQQKEERHHGRHEVGIGHFPGAAMVAAMAAALFFADDDNRRLGVVSGHVVPQPVGAASAEVASSTSRKVGRTSLSSALRAYSIDTDGAQPCRCASRPILMHCRYLPSASRIAFSELAIGPK